MPHTGHYRKNTPPPAAAHFYHVAPLYQSKNPQSTIEQVILSHQLNNQQHFNQNIKK